MKTVKDCIDLYDDIYVSIYVQHYNNTITLWSGRSYDWYENKEFCHYKIKSCSYKSGNVLLIELTRLEQ